MLIVLHLYKHRKKPITSQIVKPGTSTVIKRYMNKGPGGSKVVKGLASQASINNTPPPAVSPKPTSISNNTHNTTSSNTEHNTNTSAVNSAYENYQGPLQPQQSLKEQVSPQLKPYLTSEQPNFVEDKIPPKEPGEPPYVQDFLAGSINTFENNKNPGPENSKETHMHILKDSPQGLKSVGIMTSWKDGDASGKVNNTKISNTKFDGLYEVKKVKEINPWPPTVQDSFGKQEYVEKSALKIKKDKVLTDDYGNTIPSDVHGGQYITKMDVPQTFPNIVVDINATLYLQEDQIQQKLKEKFMEESVANTDDVPMIAVTNEITNESNVD